MYFKPKLIAAAVVSTLTVAPALSSAEAQVRIDTVTVSGILPERLEAVPGSFAVVEQSELQARQPFSVKEALNQTPGVHVVGEDSFGLGLNIGVRGMDPRRTSRTLLLEDGMPLFLAPYGDPSAHYSTPLDRVQRVEVVKGSGQVLYGPQTVGGMINFVTKPIPAKGLPAVCRPAPAITISTACTPTSAMAARWAASCSTCCRKKATVCVRTMISMSGSTPSRGCCG